MRHDHPIKDIDLLPRSTRYYWRAKLERAYTLCVWAGVRKCKLEDSTVVPTLDAIWGTQGFYANVYINRRTSEIMAAKESPGADWDNYGSMSQSNDTSHKLLSGLNLTFFAVEALLSNRMAPIEIRELMLLLPVLGKFQGEYWLSEESKIVQTEATTLRDLNHHKVMEVVEVVNLDERIDRVMQRKVMRRAISVLEQKAPVIPSKMRTQLEFDLIR